MDNDHTEYTASAGDVAGAIVSYLAPGRRVETVKLHALLYLTQGWHLVSFNEPAFADPIEARRFGPEVPAVSGFHVGTAMVGEASGFGGRGLAGLDTIRLATVEFVLANYGGVGAYGLQHYVRAPGSPWDVTYKARGDYGVNTARRARPSLTLSPRSPCSPTRCPRWVHRCGA